MTCFQAGAAAAAIATALAAAPFAYAQDQSATDIIVTARPALSDPGDRATTDALTPEGAGLVVPDAAALAARAPGAALIGNGPVSGQVQLRGLFADRLRVTIDGQPFASGGPNAMDPPLHYAPMVLIDRITLTRGAAPVRLGPGLGGAVDAVLKRTGFADADRPEAAVDLTATGSSASRSVAVGGAVGIATRRWRLGALAAFEDGDDWRFPGGTVDDTAHRRVVYGIEGGLRGDGGEVGLTYRRHETGRSGNPSFALDIAWFDTDFLRADAMVEPSDRVAVTLMAAHTAVRHRMDNVTTRPAPANPMLRRSTDTFADTAIARADVRLGSGDRHIRLGLEVEAIDKGVRIANPNEPEFFVTAIDRAAQERVGGFVEWRGAAGPVEIEAGARVDRHAAKVEAPRLSDLVMAGPRLLAARFAAGNRDWRQTGVDAVLRLWAPLGDWTPRLALSRKTRAPTAVERFSWLPTEASGGLADGNIYVGDTALRLETAWAVEGGVDYDDGRVRVTPTLSWRRIDDFVQGVPVDATPGVIDSPVEMVAAMSGDPTPLRFANVDAELWGADIGVEARLGGGWSIDGTASAVRGRRRDIDDALYRIAPARGRLALRHGTARWGVFIEGEGALAQRRVARSNDEQPTDGHALLHLGGHLVLGRGLTLAAGVHNVGDRRYADHLAGRNRVPGSDVAVGDRLPGQGRTGWVRIDVRR